MHPLAAQQSDLGSQLPFLLMIVAVGLLMWLMMRRQKKQMAQQAAMVTSLTPGTRVLLGSGFFGTIRAIDGDRAEVEIAPGVITSVLTRAIMRADNETTQTPGDDILGSGPDDAPPAGPIDER